LQSSGRLGSLLRGQNFQVLAAPSKKCYEKQARTTSLLLKAGFLGIIISVGAGIWRTHQSVGQSEAPRLVLPPSLPPPALGGAETKTAPFAGRADTFPRNRIAALCTR